MDEIDLSAPLKICRKYWFVFLLVVPAAVVYGLSYQPPQTYAFTTAIQLGRYTNPNGVALLDTALDVAARVRRLHIESDSDIPLKVTSEGNQIVVLETRTVLDNSRMVEIVHAKLAQEILEDHKKLMQALKVRGSIAIVSGTTTSTTRTSPIENPSPYAKVTVSALMGLFFSSVLALVIEMGYRFIVGKTRVAAGKRRSEIKVDDAEKVKTA